MSLMLLVFIALIGLFIIKKYIWVLVDEVYDCGDYLLVRKRALKSV